jgi:hypothetical protein
VPRFGAGSIKKIEDKYNWLMHEKPKHVEAGMDPFTYKKMEKKLEREKQDLRELKNKIVTSGPAGKGGNKDKILAQKPSEKEEGEITVPDGKVNLKQRGEDEREKIRKRERKALMKSLELAQKSTASMGKFDKKVNKYEPDAPSSMKKRQKKSSASLNKLQN